MKKLMKLMLLVCAVLCLLTTAHAAEKRDYRTMTRGGGKDTVTVMVYLCGSDLESEGACASIDLEEMAKAKLGDQVNLVVETGGAKDWAINGIEASTNQRWLIRDGKMKLLGNAGKRNMSSGSTLVSFIDFCENQFPADRYILILWDHGGGTVGGYAYDERFGKGMMSISELNKALMDANVVFDLIGFDCCLMGTAETAFMVEKYADYMVASQRTEPGEGWYYTTWLTTLGKNPSIPTEELGRVIVDSFIGAAKNGYYGSELTLSLIDLSYIPALFDEMYDFFKDAQKTLVDDKAFIAASRVMGESRAMTDNQDLVDMVYMLDKMSGSEKLLSKLDQCIVYNGATIRDHNGLCLYFPYRNLSKVSDALYIYDQIGIGETYQQFITTFASLLAGGQAYSGGGSGSPMGQTTNWWDSVLQEWDGGSGWYSSESDMYGDSLFDSLFGTGTTTTTTQSGSGYYGSDSWWDAFFTEPQPAATAAPSATDDWLSALFGIPSGTTTTTSGDDYGAGSWLDMLLGETGGDVEVDTAGASYEMEDDWLSALLGDADEWAATDPSYNTQSTWSWLDQDMISGFSDFYAENDYDPSTLAIEEKGDGFVLSLPEEQWELITGIEQRVFLDDGEGYIDLGADSLFEFDEDGDMLIEFDNTWVALDGQICCYYAVEDIYEDDDNWSTWGVVPIWYNNQDAELVVAWDDENPYGYVRGWRYADRGSTQRGLFELRRGMTFSFVCDYYTYDEEFVDSYLWGDMTVRGDIQVSYEDVGNADCLVYYQLYDVYQNSYWTEALIYSLNN